MNISTRDRLLEVAKELFSQKGYYETRISDIVNRANVAQGTFYIYFSSKEDIFLELIKKLHLELVGKLSTYRDSDKEFKEIIRDITKQFLTEVYQNRDIAQIFFGQLLGINEDFRQLYIKKISDIQQIFREVISKYYDNYTSEIISILVIGFLRQLFFNCLMEKKFNLDDMVDKAFKGIDIIVKGLEK